MSLGFLLVVLILVCLTLTTLVVARRVRLRRHLRNIDRKRAERIAQSDVVDLGRRRQGLK